MQINYIILAHKNPNQIERLVRQLNESWTNFYIHIDKNILLRPFSDPLLKYRNVYFLPEEQRQFGTWGDIAIVKAILSAMEKIIADGRKGYTILMSGQDYPLQDNVTIHDELQSKYGTQFIALFPIPQEGWPDGGLPRIRKYKINHSTRRGDFSLIPSVFDKDFYTRRTLGTLLFLSKKFPKVPIINLVFKKRKFPSYLLPYGGGVYWAFTHELILNILSFLKKHPDYLQFHEHTLCADEVFFHSIIFHLKQKKDFPIAPSITYVNWERKSGPRPVIFNNNDKEELRIASGNKLFARKFDINYDHEIMEYIDKNFLSRSFSH